MHNISHTIHSNTALHTVLGCKAIELELQTLMAT